jgi:hypothetical protein
MDTPNRRSRKCSDLDAARGLVNGVALGLLIWATILLGIHFL